VWLDGKKRLTLDRSVPQIGASAAWRAGLTGTGVKVAVLDSGYDPTHPDLKDLVIASKNFSAEPDIVDHVGHGTHVASTIAGAGAASGGEYQGVAPGAQLMIGKVCEESGCQESAMLGEWTFRSAHTPRYPGTPLALTAVRYLPTVDKDGTAATSATRLPLAVQSQVASPVRSLTLDVSYDDGKSWQSATVRKDGSGWCATLAATREGWRLGVPAVAGDHR
jgi:Subtilase family